MAATKKTMMSLVVRRAVKKPGTASREQLMDIAPMLPSPGDRPIISPNAIAKEAGVTPAMLHSLISARGKR